MGMWYDKLIFKNKETARFWSAKLKADHDTYSGSKTIQKVSKLTLLNYDKLYAENCGKGAELVPVGHDDNSVMLSGDINKIKEVLFQNSDGNLNFIAQCKCGHLKGNFHLGSVCPKCHSKVATSFADEVVIKAWLEIPESLPRFLHPVAYRVLNKWMGAVKRKITLLDCILDTEAQLPPEYSQLGQGLEYFEKNFDDIIRYVASFHRGQRAKDDAIIFEFLEKYHDDLFCRHIPILNQSLHILTHSGSMTYNDDSSQYILKTCIELGETIYQQRHQPKINKGFLEQHIYSTYKSWIEYTTSVIEDKIIHKSGFIRKCILGTRMHFTGRGVIVPITNKHWPDEIELPWRMIVGLFKLEIINRLKLKYGIDINTAQRYWQFAQIGVDENMPPGRERDQLENMVETVKIVLKELHDECPFKGFPIILGRNPTLRLGAMQLFFCVNYKTDPADDTVGMAPESISSPNAD